MSPKPDVSVARKQQIYQAALACFGRKGFHRTTMDDIVAESGMSKGALYWYFKSKKELFLSLFQELMAQVGQTWATIIDNEEINATEKLLSSMAFFRTELEEMVPSFGIMMEAWALTCHDEDMESLTREFYQPYLDMMTRIIEEGVASGEFQLVSPEATALVIMTLFDGITLAIGMGVVTFDWNKLMDAAEALILHGLGVKDQSAD